MSWVGFFGYVACYRAAPKAASFVLIVGTRDLYRLKCCFQHFVVVDRKDNCASEMQRNLTLQAERLVHLLITT